MNARQRTSRRTAPDEDAVHAAQWTATLKTYVSPVFGSLPAQAVDTALVMRVIEPLWTDEARNRRTAARSHRNDSRLGTRTRISDRENPARWKGHLDHLLPARNKVRKIEHHAALPYAEIGNFMVELRQVDSVPARALELMILTATRTSETLNATWSEIDLDGAVWTVPAERMKGGKAHRIPLSDAALALLERACERSVRAISYSPVAMARSRSAIWRC